MYAEQGKLIEMRQVGQRLSGIIALYVLRPERDPRFLEEASELGSQCGKVSLAAGVGLVDAIEAYLFFRGGQSELMTRAGGADAAGCLAACARYNEIVGQVLTGMVSEYEKAG
jgi:hypothetical protein